MDALRFPLPFANTLHILPKDFSAKPLQESFQFNPELAGEIIGLNDPLFVGPLENLDSSEGRKARIEWLRENLFDGIDQNNEPLLRMWAEDNEKLERIGDKLYSSNLCIWTGRNTFDQLMLGRMAFLFKDALNAAFIVPVSETLLTSRTGTVYSPSTLNTLTCENIVSVSNSLRPLQLAEIEKAVYNWTNATSSSGLIRILNQSDEIVLQSESFYDDALLKNCKTEFQSAARVVGETLIDIDFNTNDHTLNWRLKSLIKQGRLESAGELKWLSDYQVRLIHTN